MEIFIILSSITIVVLIIYIINLQLQLKQINRQLQKRLKEKTIQPLSLQLINKELSLLAKNVNSCFVIEEQLRLDAVHKENEFKEMIANVSHDLRTPLTVIKGHMQLIEKDTTDDAQMQKIHIALRHADELESLINHFFEYSYLVNMEPKLQKTKINLTNLVAETIADFVSAFEEKGLSVSFEQNLPIFIWADREMTMRIVQNLIRNCISHSAGNVTIQIIQEPNTILSFYNPIKEADLLDVKNIFERFYTMDRSSIGSTGVGLSIVKLLINQMGGKVNASLEGNNLSIEVEFAL